MIASSSQTDNLIYCPHCLCRYDFKKVRPSYIHHFKGMNDRFYVSLCSKCHCKMLNEEQSNINNMARRISKNLISHTDKWLSATGDVALLMNNEDFSLALLNGHGLSNKAFKAIHDGRYVRFPSHGRTVLVSWE
jgi:hypothetical protein